MEVKSDVIRIRCEETTDPVTGEAVPYSDLSGISYARYLRRVRKKLNPIVFESFLSADQLLSLPNTAILTALGHYYIRLPFSPEEYEEVLRQCRPLTEIQLRDVVINYCHVRSAVRESFHAFKGRLREIRGMDTDEERKRQQYDMAFDLYRKELLLEAGGYPQLLEEYDRIVSQFRRSAGANIDGVLDIQEESLVRLLPAEENEDDSTATERKPWRILFLDDRPDELKGVGVFDALDSRLIPYDCVTSVAAAKKAIEEDLSNRYTVVVSDYRLLEEHPAWSRPRMQAQQGYDFLLWLSGQARFATLIALSGLSKWFLMESFREHQVNVKVYSKSTLSGNGLKLFIDDLEQHGDRQFGALLNQPKATLWDTDVFDKKSKTPKITNHSLKRYYLFHRSHPLYEVYENEINRMAEKVAREVEYALDKKADNFAPIISVTGGILTNMKGDLNGEYDIFRTKLFFRRVFFYLQIKGFEPKSIASMLQSGNPETSGTMSPSMLKQIPLYLAIRTTGDIPHGLLVEEVSFLQHYMQLPIYEVAKLMDQTHAIINRYIDQHLDDLPQAKEGLQRYVHRGSVLAVSMGEIHIILGKLSELMPDKAFLSLLAEIEEIVDTLCFHMDRFKELKNTKEKLSMLKQSKFKAQLK